MLGALGAVLASRALAGMLYGIKGAGSISLLLAACVLAAAAVLGMAVPVSRAVRIDPMQALRQE